VTSGKGRTSKVRLDVALSAERGRVMGELSARTQWRNFRKARSPPGLSTPLMSPMDQKLTRRAVAVVLREGGRSWLVQASLGRPCQAIPPRVFLKIPD